MTDRRGADEPVWRSTEIGGHTIASRHWSPPGLRDGDGSGVSAGSTRDVVLVHGLVVSSSYHVPLAQRLADRYAVHAPDLPGFGRSSRPGSYLDTRELGRILAAWIEARDLRGATLVANSYGCQVMTETLLGRPDLAARVVLLAPTMERTARRVDEQLRRWRMEQKTQSRPLRSLLVRDYLAAGIPRALATFQHALDDAIEDRLPFLDQPTLVCRGTRDPIISQAWADEVAATLRNGRSARLPGATHAVNHEQPLQTARVIDGFIARTAA